MPSLHAQRRRETPFNPRFHERDPMFWPLARAASTFASEPDWPGVGAERAFAIPPVVRFEETLPLPRRRRRSLDPVSLYDARITRDRCVPTRPRSWHDYLNALVWATFPGAKQALHARQHRALVERIDPDAGRLPATRSREHDALALIDEGGAVVLRSERRSRLVLFGHGLYEGLVLGVRPTMARAIVATLPDGDVDDASCTAIADEAITAKLAEATLTPESIPWIEVPGASEARF